MTRRDRMCSLAGRGSRMCRRIFREAAIRMSLRSHICRRQLCICFCFCLFRRASVRALVSRKCCSAGKSLLAVCKWTFEGSETKVNTSVTGEGARIAKGFSTCPTCVWLDSSMYSRMNGQSGALNEAFSTCVTNMRSLTTVNAFMSSKVTAASETFGTRRTNKHFGRGVTG